MNKIIPFKKKLTFNTNVNEITSIALENTLTVSDKTILGDLIINGSYKIVDTSINVDEFEFKIPVNIEIDEKYELDNLTIDIDDFYYEIINNNILEVNIDILLDNLIEKKEEIEEIIEIPIQEEHKEEKKEVKIMERCIETEEPKEIQKPKEIINEEKNIDLFTQFTNDTEDYSTYHVYIVREGDNIESIISNYKITKEILSEYNDINEIKIGDKLIIPSQNE